MPDNDATVAPPAFSIRLAPRRSRRSVLRILRDLPGDWLFERSAIPGKIMGAVMILMVATLPAAGVASLGTVLTVNWMVSQTPAVTQLGRFLAHTATAWRGEYARRAGAGETARDGRTATLRRSLTAVIDPTWWTRPQMRQLADVAANPELPAEIFMDPRDPRLPRPAQLILRLQQWMIRTAEPDAFAQLQRGTAPTGEQPAPPRVMTRRERVGRWFAGQGDDWLALRARTPAFVVGIGLVVAGYFTGVPTTLNFLVNAVVGWLPAAVALYMWRATGDAYRATRPGLMQRPSVIRRYLAKHPEAARSMAAPTAPTAPEAPLPAAGPVRAEAALEGFAQAVLSRSPLAMTRSVAVPVRAAGPGVGLAAPGDPGPRRPGIPAALALQ